MRFPIDLSILRRALTSVRPGVRNGALALVIALGAAAVAWAGEEEVDYNRDVRPILNGKCITCHGGVKRAGGFGVLFREDALVKGESGRVAIVPGDPDASELIRRITHPDAAERMPRHGEPLSGAEIDILRRWIEQGAQWEDHWAYVPPKPQALPRVSDGRWPRNGIDRFVLARLDAEELKPSGPARCATLIRRVSLDLIGLPPAPQEVADFCKDPSPAAYERVVDRLLASPRYGEHWAASWLDLARHADTKGYEKDQHREMWPYRDWVIRAMNRDLPFDRFTVEQLAGDLLPDATDDQVLATAFHRNTMANDEDGTDDEEFRVSAVIDRLTTTWQIWQGTTMGCVQCHDHPYDPFRHKEFYQLSAFFDNTADADRKDDAPRLPAYGEEQSRQLRALLDQLDVARGRKAPASAALVYRIEEAFFPLGRFPLANVAEAREVSRTSDFVAPLADGAWARYPGVQLTGVGEVGLTFSGSEGAIEVRLDGPQGRLLGRAELKPPPPRPVRPAAPRPSATAAATPPRPVGPPPRPGLRGMEPTARLKIAPVQGRHDLVLVFRVPRAGTMRLTALALYPPQASADEAASAAVAELKRQVAAVPTAAEVPVLHELPAAQRRVTRVFERGNWLVKADTVAPGVPKSMPALPRGAPADRLGMAEWLVSERNPLTARVTVNRYWAQLFGTGIVESLEDFGTQGSDPSHPELLDWLALRFMNEHRWSVKSLLREIVLSATYQQESTVTPDMRERDPYNRLLARGPRVRLSAEQVRDQALAAAGLLSEKMYGPSVMPPQPPGLWSSPYNSLDWSTSAGEDRYRRAVYTYWKRTVPYPSFLSFDAPTREFTLARRTRTNTPLQALVTLNDPVYVEAAQALARHMARGGSSLDDQLRLGYRRALGQDPDPTVVGVLRSLYERSAGHYRAHPELVRDAVAPYRPYDDADGYPTAAAAPPQPERADSVVATAPGDEVALAALTAVAEAILNLDAFLTKE